MAYVDEVLTTIGVTVKVGDTAIQGAYNYSDLGAAPNDLDATPLSSQYSVKKAGLIDLGNWELDYYYNAKDWGTIETAKAGGTAVALTVTFPGGDVFSNTGTVGSNYLTGQGVGSMAQAKAVFALAGGWTRTAG
jgi:hypothetical protein